MPSTFFGLSIGKTGLNIAQAGINTTAHNSANATTKGYSRQTISSTAATPLSLYSRAGMAGTGVELTGIERQRNIYYDEKYRISNCAYGNYSTKEYYMTSIQNYFKETEKDAKGLTYSMNNFYTSMETLKGNPADSNTRTQFVESANSLTQYINYLSKSLQEVQSEANTEIKTTAERINSVAAQISSLNRQINTLEIQGGMANDLRDARDLLLDELSEYGNITVEEQNIGDDRTKVNQFVVYLDGKTLVDTYKYNTLVVSSMKGKNAANDMSGMYELSWSDGQDFNSASSTLGGKLQALFEIRDGNNETNFQGTSKVVPQLHDTSITVVNTNCNEINQLNIPQEKGRIKIGANEYTYDSFQVTILDDGSYEYTFDGLKGENGEGITQISKDKDGNPIPMSVSIGDSVNYKGVPYYQAQLNEFVRTVSEEINMIHNSGQDQTEYNAAGLDFFNGTDAATGKNYDLVENGTSVKWTDPETGKEYTKTSKVSGFTSTGGAVCTITYTAEDGTVWKTENQTDKTSYYNVSALNFGVTKEIQNNVLLVATTSDMNAGQEATDIVDKMIAKIKDKGLFKQGTASEYLQTFTSNIGTDTAQAELFTTSQSNINKAIDKQRMSISSVDSDEEAMNLVKFQNAYELSGKVISTMTELYDVLMNM